MSEMRWDPLRREWVVTATHRENRDFMPPEDYCPLCPTEAGGFPTEVPAEDYNIVVFENKFPSFQSQPPEPVVEDGELLKTKQAKGICEVILYSPEHNGTLTDKSVDKIRQLVRVWKDRYQQLGKKDYIDYVFIFENKGKEVGVTLSHPHGQIYAYPFVPPVPQRELDSSREYLQRTGNCLFCQVLQKELEDGSRLVAENDKFVAFVPYYSRHTYGIHVYARQHRPSLAQLTELEERKLAELLKVVMLKYDNLFGFPFPYVMVMHQQPTGQQVNAEDYSHFHIEFYPPYRTKDKLKHCLAGSESGAGVFVNGSHPEAKAQELRETEPEDINQV